MDRVEEMSVWLASFGIDWRAPDEPSLSFLIRALIAAEPSYAWCMEAMRSRLGALGHAMSEASLRRRLAEETTSFTALLIDTRLSYALEELQGTSRSVTQIELDAGYDSPSRFAVRFRARFGLAPSEIRGHLRSSECIGTKVDRPGTALLAAE
jgi:AraC-like DNA-binding protein